MVKGIDDFLNGITMYRLVLYELLALLGIAVIFAFVGKVPYPPFAIIETAIFLVAVCYWANILFSSLYRAPTNVESVYITAFILTLIVSPIRSYHDLIFFAWLGVVSMASKYVFAIGKKHIFNPAAISAVVCSFFLGQSVNWWIGTSWMTPFIFITGFLIVRKIQKEDLVYSFFLTALLAISFFTFYEKGNVISALQATLFSSSLLFFGFVMFTEPLTTPPTKNLRIIYGVLAGLLFAPQVHFWSLYLTPELVLVTVNIFSYVVSPKQRLILTLKEKIKVGLDQIDFIFTTPKHLRFVPGQYLEWTMPHKNTDSRGNRRYFTIASSPTENDIHLGVKFYPGSSSFKKALIDECDMIAAGQLAGDFTLPKNTAKKLVFIAGGIGITPFRSMIKYLLDKKEKRDVVLFYSNTLASEIMYKEVWDEAEKSGIKIFYTISDTNHIPKNWKGYIGRISADGIQKDVPDYKERLFYLSGPHSMVIGFEQTLRQMGIPNSHIKKDFFPGYA